VLVFGGDPLLDPKFLKDLYEARRWESFFFSTNGILFTQKEAQDLISLPNVRFQISFETNDWGYRISETNRHQSDLLTPALQLLKGRHLDFRITIPQDAPYVPLKSIIERLEDTLECGDFKISYWPAHATELPPWIDKWIEESYRLMEEDSSGFYKNKLISHHVSDYFEESRQKGFRFANCNAGYGSVAVGPDGSLHGCHELAIVEDTKDLVGHLGIPQIEFAKRRNLVSQWANAINKDICAKCSARYVCGGVCFMLDLPVAACRYLQKTFALGLTEMVKYAPHKVMPIVARSEQVFDHFLSNKSEIKKEVESTKWKQLVSGELPLEKEVDLAEQFLNI
jgi:radical SAM protein with 4Fe4S-binding SPASM domain